MDFTFSDEQQMLQDTVQRFVTQDYTFETRRAIVKSEAGYSRDMWRKFAELGLLGVPFPDTYGGFGGSAVDTMVVMDALGRGLVVEPYLATVVLGGGLVLLGGSEAQKQALIPQVIEGKLLLALAHGERQARYELTSVQTAAKREGESYVVSGAKSVVLHGAQADKLIVSARTGGAARDAKGVSLFLVDRSAPGVSVRGYPTIDGLRAAEVRLENVRVGSDALIGEADNAFPLIERATDRAVAALCAEAVGVMKALDDATLEYLKTRQQFGVPIGRFQVLQHRMVDMLIHYEQAKSMSYLAAVHADDPDAAERRRILSAAKARVGQAGRFVGQQAIQLHGGMGMTEELIVSHYFKRLTMIDQTLGDTDYHLARFGQAMAAGK